MPDANATGVGSESICTQCGLCCDGSLFRAARLKADDDRALMADVGINFLETDRQFELPCPCLVDKRCGIYDRRFSTCRRFRCRLLKDVEDRGTPRAEALRVIAHATALSRAVRAALADEGIPAGASLAVAVGQWRAGRIDQATNHQIDVLYGALRALAVARFSTSIKGAQP